MRRYFIVITLGALWGVAGVILLAVVGQTPDAILGVVGDRPVSSTDEIFFDDRLNPPLKLLLFPMSVGVDLLRWGVGFFVWLFTRQGWPGSALGAVIGPYPTLAWILVLLFSALAGAGLSWALAWCWNALLRLGDSRNTA